MNEAITTALLKTLSGIGPGRVTRLDALTTYINADLLNYADRDTVQAHLNQLEVRGLARHETSPASPNVTLWSITKAGLALAATLP